MYNMQAKAYNINVVFVDMKHLLHFSTLAIDIKTERAKMH